MAMNRVGAEQRAPQATNSRQRARRRQRRNRHMHLPPGHEARRAAAVQGAVSTVCPACTIEIVPAHRHDSVALSHSVGMPASSTVVEPGTQGEGVAGTQGIGVNTPDAAEVADATTGLASERHMPNEVTLTIGTWSATLAHARCAPSTVRGVGSREPGATPIVQRSVAPVQAMKGIVTTAKR
jgi:hypothetical protein